MEYIRRAYGVPAKRGGRVEYVHVDAGETLRGTIVGSRNQYLRVRWDHEAFTRTHHPTSVVYVD